MTATLWDELLTAALLGTARRSFELPPLSGPLGELLAGIDPRDAEAALLGAVAAMALFQAVGQVPETAADVVLSPAPSDEGPEASEQAGNYLRRLLEHQLPLRQELLREWLDALAASGRRAPPGCLPTLLDYAAAEPAIQPRVREIIGERGRWLAGLNPAWRFALSPELPTEPDGLDQVWQQGSRVERIELLRQLRAHDPASGLALLETTWQQERAGERAAFLAELAIGLSILDEPFLEQALDDRSKDVRGTAADLLLQLPDSRLRRRVVQHSAALLEWQPPRLMRRARINVTPPSELDSALIRDGIVAEAQNGQGKRSWWLLQFVGRVPLSEWCRRWNAKPQELLTAEVTEEWRAALIAGWERAALRYADTEWANALLRRWLARGERLNAPPAALLSVLPPAEREALVLEVLGKHRELLQAEHPALPLLEGCQHQWSVAFSRVVIEHISHHFAQQNAQKHDLSLHSMLSEAGPRMAPELSDEVSALADRIQMMLYWGKLMRQLADLLAFRRDMLEELYR